MYGAPGMQPTRCAICGAAATSWTSLYLQNHWEARCDQHPMVQPVAASQSFQAVFTDPTPLARQAAALLTSLNESLGVRVAPSTLADLRRLATGE